MWLWLSDRTSRFTIRTFTSRFPATETIRNTIGKHDLPISDQIARRRLFERHVHCREPLLTGECGGCSSDSSGLGENGSISRLWTNTDLASPMPKAMLRQYAYSGGGALTARVRCELSSGNLCDFLSVDEKLAEHWPSDLQTRFASSKRLFKLHVAT